MFEMILVIWIVIINIIGFAVCAVDKRRARNRRWRIPEKTIFGISIAGGSIGVYFSMLLLRHKTKHLRFMIGIPVILVVQASAVIYLVLKG